MNHTIAILDIEPKHFTPGDIVTVTDIAGQGIVKRAGKNIIWVQYPHETLPVYRLNVYLEIPAVQS